MFEINYQTTDGTMLQANLVPNSTLGERIRVLEHTKTILLIDKIELGLLLLAHFMWEEETSIPGFFSFETSVEPTEIEIQRSQLYNTIRRVITDKAERFRLAQIVFNTASCKQENGEFIVPMDTEDPHDYSIIPDQAIADLIQSIVINQFENILKLI